MVENADHTEVRLFESAHFFFPVIPSNPLALC